MKGFLVILLVGVLSAVNANPSPPYYCECGTGVSSRDDDKQMEKNTLMYHQIIGNVDSCGEHAQKSCNQLCVQVFGIAIPDLNCKRPDGRRYYDISCALLQKDVSHRKVGVYSMVCNDGKWTYGKTINDNFCCNHNRPCNTYY